jgi:hypothetical protein
MPDHARAFAAGKYHTDTSTSRRVGSRTAQFEQMWMDKNKRKFVAIDVADCDLVPSRGLVEWV